MERIEQDYKLRNNLNDKNNQYGEITGQKFMISQIDHGMPLRSMYNTKKVDYDKLKSYNRNDFDLFDDASGKMTNITYDDSDQGKLINDTSGISININKFSINLFSLLKRYLNDHFCISPYGLYNIFGVIYFSSKGISENDLSKYFLMIHKNEILGELTSLKQLLDKIIQTKQLILKDIILINNDLTINKTYIEYTDSIIEIYPFCLNNYENETININKYINKLSNSPKLLIQPISNKIIAKGKIISLNCGFIKPIWKEPFDKIFDSKFIGNTTRIIKTLGQIDHHYEYYEDNFNQLIEFRCIGDILSMGIILPKEYIEPNITYEQISLMMKNIKMTYLDEVRIPVFTEQIKMKLTNVLYHDGLKSIFHKLYIPEFINKETKISDIVQNLTIIITNNDNIKHHNKQINSYISNIKFIADHPFIYYFKLIPTNTIIIMGYYC